MQVTDGQLAVLRAHLAGDVDEFDRLIDDEASSGVGWNVLISAALFKAARSRFHTPDRPEIMRFTAEMRGRLDPRAEHVDPVAAERVLMALVDDHPDDEPSDIDDKTMGTVQMTLLTALVDDAQMDDDALDAFLADARTLADEWIG